MPDYKPDEAREWARGHLTGCSAVTSPTFTADLRRLNEDAIRHDVKRVMEHGFSYTLLMAETAITPEEVGRFTAIAREAAGGRLRLFAHTAFGTLADNIEALRHAEREGADLVLLSYPPQFWPTSEEQIYDWTKSICDATSLGAMLFPIPLWGFERVHPAGMSVEFVRHVLDTIPNIVAIKPGAGVGRTRWSASGRCSPRGWLPARPHRATPAARASSTERTGSTRSGWPATTAARSGRRRCGFPTGS